MTRADDSTVCPHNSSRPTTSELIVIYIGAAEVEKEEEKRKGV